MPEYLSEHEELVWRVYRLGLADAHNERVGRGLDEILRVCESEASLDAAVESREERLARELKAERAALARLRR